MHSDSTAIKSINKIRTNQSPWSTSNTAFIYITLFDAQDIAHLSIHNHITCIPETINVTWNFGNTKIQAITFISQVNALIYTELRV